MARLKYIDNEMCQVGCRFQTFRELDFAVQYPASWRRIIFLAPCRWCPPNGCCNLLITVFWHYTPAIVFPCITWFYTSANLKCYSSRSRQKVEGLWINTVQNEVTWNCWPASIAELEGEMKQYVMRWSLWGRTGFASDNLMETAFIFKRADWRSDIGPTHGAF